MAPRKRTTKQRKNNPKSAKLEAFLEDFDLEVKTRVGQLKEKINQLLKDVDNSYNMALIKLPKAVRQTSWLEHCSELIRTKQKEEAAMVESVVAEDHAVLLKTVKSRSNRKPLVTPARSVLDSSVMMGTTPLITPRFDPRLPKTPAVRVPRHKERVYSISVNGSPIAAGDDDIVINVPVGNGESIQLLASHMDSVDLSLLDETALRTPPLHLCGSGSVLRIRHH
uniref:Cell division cycle associated 8 n=1 Tax=Acanthochromis polyacanthus TaxID=80966 RepID=A0A3Q1FSF7_9TELE